ncbi:DUF305 domain-containing protein [Streptomyces albidus (ex Kaewkla and Franco 2022)]|uniref:DUF305 domain-containing protein n=1 Tax=Streptomyces albidus (ex Kaewkla and Franco 2022) TaxID=722709 RepID=UPI0015EEE624|nr:DUF305 domain-containing protein [Streptomyces albidus (ex Kaewkla and Franco 2022)]
MNTFRSLNRGALAAGSALAAALLLAACGGGQEAAGGDDHGGAHSGGHGGKKSAGKSGNAADVSFAQGMIPHHRQALEMAKLAPSRASSGEVKSLAADIAGAQQPEIRTMSGWLKAWGEKAPAESSGGEHSGHSGHSMPGMMTPDDMKQLKDGSGKKFDEAFLKMMVAHHEGAVAMARTEESEGSDKAAKAMARDIRRMQTEEITKMRGLLEK